MQFVSRDEFLELLGLTSGAFDQLQFAGHVALAFNTRLPATAGRYLDLDLIAMAINLGLTPYIGRDAATAIVGGFFHQWAAAVGHAEADRSKDYFMAAIGVDWDAIKRRSGMILVTHGSQDEIAKDFRDAKNPVGMFTVNVSDIIRRLRERAADAGIDLSQPFFFAPGDPRFNEILTRVKREFEGRVARLRRDKKTLAAVRSRTRREDIAALPRVAKSEYPLELGAV
jgi:hypothetical protein